MPLTQESAARKDRTTANTAELQHRHFAFIAATIAGMPDHAATLRAQKQTIRCADVCRCMRPV